MGNPDPCFSVLDGGDARPPRNLPTCVPERPLQGEFATGLYCPDKLPCEDLSWLLRAPEGSSTEPEQCPNIDSQRLPEEEGEGGSLEQVQSLVVGEVMKDIDTACTLLNITADPAEWSMGNVQKWLLWTEHLYRLPQTSAAFRKFSGRDLCAMSEDHFRQLCPETGDMLHAHLDIWKSAAWMKSRCSPENSRITEGEEPWAEADSSCSGQPVHLWQFLRELLLRPHTYGRYIRWLNKERGVFKIEDSARVARLWGLRKNRPAMNYDKLSRSIRQYYRKGIIRKPAMSQRLVYQFVHPV